MLNDVCVNIIVHAIIVLLKGTVIFRHEWFGIIIYELCESMGYTFNMSVQFGKNRKHYHNASQSCNCHITDCKEHMLSHLLIYWFIHEDTKLK
jgi:hypothetical protein